MNELMYIDGALYHSDQLMHHGVKGMKWGVRKDAARKAVSRTARSAYLAGRNELRRAGGDAIGKAAVEVHKGSLAKKFGRNVSIRKNVKKALTDNFTKDKKGTYLHERGNELYDKGRQKVIDKYYTKNGEVQTKKMKVHKTAAVTAVALGVTYASNPSVRSIVDRSAKVAYKKVAQDISTRRGVYNISNGTHRYVVNRGSDLVRRMM